MIDDVQTVLLVEDDPDDEELTIRGLKRTNLKNPVDVARDGQEALDYLFGTDEQAAQPLPAVVLLDLRPYGGPAAVMSKLVGTPRADCGG